MDPNFVPIGTGSFITGSFGILSESLVASASDLGKQMVVFGGTVLDVHHMLDAMLKQMFQGYGSCSQKMVFCKITDLFFQSIQAIQASGGPLAVGNAVAVEIVAIKSGV